MGCCELQQPILLFAPKKGFFFTESGLPASQKPASSANAVCPTALPPKVPSSEGTACPTAASPQGSLFSERCLLDSLPSQGSLFRGSCQAKPD